MKKVTLAFDPAHLVAIVVSLGSTFGPLIMAQINQTELAVAYKWLAAVGALIAFLTALVKQSITVPTDVPPVAPAPPSSGSGPSVAVKAVVAASTALVLCLAASGCAWWNAKGSSVMTDLNTLIVCVEQNASTIPTFEGLATKCGNVAVTEIEAIVTLVTTPVASDDAGVLTYGAPTDVVLAVSKIHHP